MAELAVQEKISQSSRLQYKYNTLMVQYEDGYIQRAREGINRVQESWQVTWSNLTATEMNTLRTFIDSVEMSDSFTWNPADEDYLGSPIPEKKWIFDPERDISVVNKSGQIYDVRATLKRVYDL